MKGIVITVNDKMRVVDFGDPLYETIGAAVGGYIEIVHPQGLEDPYIMIVNEEGLLLGLPENGLGCGLYGTILHGSPIVGDIVLMKMGFRDGEPDIVGLSDWEVSEFLATFHRLTRGRVTLEEPGDPGE